MNRVGHCGEFRSTEGGFKCLPRVPVGVACWSGTGCAVAFCILDRQGTGL